MNFSANIQREQRRSRGVGQRGVSMRRICSPQCFANQTPKSFHYWLCVIDVKAAAAATASRAKVNTKRRGEKSELRLLPQPAPVCCSSLCPAVRHRNVHAVKRIEANIFTLTRQKDQQQQQQRQLEQELELGPELKPRRLDNKVKSVNDTVR